MNEIIKQVFEIGKLLIEFDGTPFIYLCLISLMMGLAKKTFDFTSSYDLDSELVEKDNKAVAVTFCGYMVGVGMILYGFLKSDSVENLWHDILLTILWGLIAIGMLIVARVLSDKVLLHQFSTAKEIIEDRNVGTGAVEGGASLGLAFIIKAAVSNENLDFTSALVFSLTYFALGFFGLFFFSKLYGKIVGFDVHKEIEKDNVAAGVSFGMYLVSTGILLGGYIKYSYNIPGFMLWIVLAAFLLVTLRYLIDKLLLPKQNLSDEIRNDQNWGAALIEGSVAIVVAFIVNAAFFGGG